MGPCGRCWGKGRTLICEMDDDRTVVGDEVCADCRGSGIEPPPMRLVMDFDAPLPAWIREMDESYETQYPNEWDI